MPSNPIYDKRTPHYRKAYAFPPNQTKWWKKNNKNPIVRAVINHALTIQEPFTARKIYEGAKYINGKLVRNSGVMSPNLDKVSAMIRYCGYFGSEKKTLTSVRLWRKK